MEGKDEHEAQSFDVGRLTSLGKCIGNLEVVEVKSCCDLLHSFLDSNGVGIAASLKHKYAANKYVI